jgi:hypothetical protein
MVDKKGALVFAIAVLVLSYGYIAGTAYTGLFDLGQESIVPRLFLLGFILTPALAAWIARPFARALPTELPAIAPGSFRRILGVALLPFVVSILIHLTISVLGKASPDWGLGKVVAGIEPYLAQTGQSAGNATGQIVAVLLVLLPIMGIVLGATVYAVAALGSELGFRRFLQPRLIRGYDRPLTYAMTALVFVLWLAPLFVLWKIQVGDGESGIAQVRAAMPRFALLLTALTVMLGEVQRRSGSTGLAAVFLGSFFAQSSYLGAGMWSSLYSQVVEPWTGTFGWVSVVLWCLTAAVVYAFPSRVEATRQAPAKEDSGKGGTGPQARPKVRPRAEA